MTDPKATLIPTLLAGLLIALLPAVGIAQSSPDQPNTGISIAEFEETIMSLPLFSEIVDNWENKSQPGNIARMYKPIEVIETFPAGEQIIFPEPGDLIIYQLTGLSYNNPNQRPEDERITATSVRITAIDARTRKVIAWNELPIRIKGNPHTSPVSPDGRYIYAAGPPLTNFRSIEFDESLSDNSGCTSPVCMVIPQTYVKIDTLTLQPVKVISAPGRQHHGHVFRDRYMLFDSFSKDVDGLDTFIFDPETDQVIAGVRNEELGGSTYTAWTDHQNEFIYHLMEPAGYTDRPTTDGYLSAHWLRQQGFTATKPYWVAQIRVSEDLQDWEVVREYPYFGNRGNWIEVAPDRRHMYINSGGMNITQKIDMKTGQAAWSTPVGDGPYGNELTADLSELWVLNKGETTGMWGHDIHIIDTATGERTGVVNTGFTSDHVLLSPDGKEMWVSSNGSGKLFVYDIETRKLKSEIHLPGYGDPHGIPFVYYDEDGSSRLVSDQNGFHNGVDPQMGRPLEYETTPAPSFVSNVINSVTGEEPSEPVRAKPLAMFADEAVMIDESPPNGDSEHGKELFQSATGCQLCHGPDAKGRVGPNIRMATVPMVINAMQSFNDMIAWRRSFPDLFEEQSLNDIVTYLQTLPRD
jgi:DNA-binding beta-propeller fold protein YncE